MKALINDRLRVMAALNEQLSDLDREVFVDLEKHGVYAGTDTRRSRLSSAAYAMAALISSDVNEG